MVQKSGQLDGKENRMVSFRPTLEVLYFSIDVSDNPGGSTAGPPIQLGWEMIDKREINIIEWESRDRHGRKVLKIRNAARVDILMQYGVSLDDIHLYEKSAMTVRNLRKMSVKRVKWDRLDERKESFRRVLLQCRFSEAMLPYPKDELRSCSNGAQEKKQELKEGAEIDNEYFEPNCNPRHRFSKRNSCPYFGVVALEMDDPNSENALMYNTEFTKVFRRASTSLITDNSRGSFDESLRSEFRRHSMILARDLSRREQNRSQSMLSASGLGDKGLWRSASDSNSGRSSTFHTSE